MDDEDDASSGPPLGHLGEDGSSSSPSSIVDGLPRASSCKPPELPELPQYDRSTFRGKSPSIPVSFSLDYHTTSSLVSDSPSLVASKRSSEKKLSKPPNRRGQSSRARRDRRSRLQRTGSLCDEENPPNDPQLDGVKSSAFHASSKRHRRKHIRGKSAPSIAQLGTIKVEPLAKRLTTRAREVRRILRRDCMYRYLLDFAQSQHSAENVEFWKAVETFRRVSSITSVDPAGATDKALMVNSAANSILDQYVVDGAPKQVHLHADVREALLGRSREYSPSSFDLAQQEVFSVISSSLWSSFLKSDQFSMMNEDNQRIGAQEHFSLEMMYNLMWNTEPFAPCVKKSKKPTLKSRRGVKKPSPVSGAQWIDWLCKRLCKDVSSDDRKRACEVAQALLDESFVVPAKQSKRVKKRTRRFKDSSSKCYSLNPKLPPISGLIISFRYTSGVTRANENISRTQESYVRLLKHLVEPIPEHQDYIFELLYRTEYATARTQGGDGTDIVNNLVSRVGERAVYFQKNPIALGRHLLDRARLLNHAMKEFPFIVTPRDYPVNYKRSIVYVYEYLNAIIGRVLLEAHKIRKMIGKERFEGARTLSDLTPHKDAFPGIPLRTGSFIENARAPPVPPNREDVGDRGDEDDKKDGGGGGGGVSNGSSIDGDHSVGEGESSSCTDDDGADDAAEPSSSPSREAVDDGIVRVSVQAEIATLSNLASLIALASEANKRYQSMESSHHPDDGDGAGQAPLEHVEQGGHRTEPAKE